MKKMVSRFLSPCVCLFLMTGCMQANRHEADDIDNSSLKRSDMQILVQGEQGQEVVFQLNDSKAAHSLYEQLPLSIEVEDDGNREKLFYPEKPLDTRDALMAEGPAGTLAYYEPWGDVVMFYDVCDSFEGLYALGEAISGTDQIAQLGGKLKLTTLQGTRKQKAEANSEMNPQQKDAIVESKDTNNQTKEEDAMFHVLLTVKGVSFSASLYDNEAVRSLMERLPMTITMDDLHRNEKYFYVSDVFPSAAQQVSQIHTGDLKLFGNDCLVLFYKDFTTSYAYTSLGQLDDPQGLEEVLGSGSVSIHFEQIP